MQMQSWLLYVLIVGCEVAFWLVLLFGLAVRYVWRREVASRWLLRSLPVIDLVLMAFTALDLSAGTPATFAHGLAAAYVGFTIAFGAMAIRWADARFAYRFAGGPKPPAPHARGWKAVRFDIELWVRAIVAWMIALVLIEALIALIGNEANIEPLRAWYRIAAVSTFFWFLFGPLWSLLFLSREPRTNA